MLVVIFECDKNSEHKFSKTERELAEEKRAYTYCWCGGRYRMGTIDLAAYIVGLIADDYLNTWFNELGIEGTIELIERNKDLPTSWVYIERLKKKGLWK